MILVQQSGNVYNIKFKYDQEIIDIVKQIPGRRWEPDLKIWTIPTDKLGFLLAQFKATKFENDIKIESNEHLNENDELAGTRTIPEWDISNVPYYVADGMKPFSHQLDTMKYYLWRINNGFNSGFLLADEPGAGKTLQIMNIALWKKHNRGSKHCLIIACVNSAKYNWVEDIKKHSNGTEVPYVLGSRIRRNGTINCSGSSKDKMKDLCTGKMYGKENGDDLPYFIVTNIEAFRTSVGRTKVFTGQIIKMIEDGEIDTIAIDEIHKNASPSSIQGQQLLQIKKKITKQIEWFPMTGTPITSKPTDVFTPLRLIDGHSQTSFWGWCQTFCVYGGFGGKEVIGYKNVPYLKTLLQPNMLRRLKKDILDLPPKVYHEEYVENTPYQQKLYNEICSEMLSQREEIMHSMNPMTRFLRLRQVNGAPELVDPALPIDKSYLSHNAKFQRALELIDEIVEAGEKVIVFSNWVEPLRTFYRFVSAKYKVCCYTGTMNSDEREKHKSVFINNPNYQIMIGTIGALGTSHTLTVASNIIFLDECWNPSDQQQAEDRCVRPGQTSTVNIYVLLSKDTVDDRVHSILSKKDGISKYIVDNELDMRKNPDLFDMLIN